MAKIASQQISAINDLESAENKIHSDDIAQKFGFTGALVSGTTVFAYLTQALVKVYGEQWLCRGLIDVVFLKPAYQDDLLSIHTENSEPADGQRHHLTSAYNEDGVLLARLESRDPAVLPPVNTLAGASGSATTGPRVEIAWKLIHLQQAAPTWLWQPTADDNQRCTDRQRDPALLYRGEAGFVHPYLLLAACNEALKRMFILPAWIHTASRMTSRQPVKLGRPITVHTVPIQKWERRGHQFIKLYIAMWIDDAVVLEVEHSAIFKISG